ncbi:hypothetical protein J2S74_000731 [Evansella vedderi]|uniref:AIPR protein n=1 Tax=Evansella vedderi TaxID=38282 RepID=A0ABT9ZR65_9BACI|nr:AIPR family protein [Evansella vedderi]MDQ0253359.1 hypothetical protein [Evansella vedderi]
MKLEEFINSFKEEIENDVENSLENREQIFTEKMYEYLSDNGITENVEKTFGKKHAIGIKVNAYSLNEEKEKLTLFVSEYDSVRYGKSISQKNVEKAIRRVVRYFNTAVKGMVSSLEETAPDYSLAQLIYEEYGKTFKHVEYFLLTNSLYKANETINPIKGAPINYQIWDIERLYQLINETQGLETIEIDFEKNFNNKLQLMKVPSTNNSLFDCYIGYIPAKLLADVYSKWGQRLIERNVRSFLQARGKVNKGIRNTLKDQSEMFVAYNNGISTIAESADINPLFEEGNLYEIISLKGWQIVNGGQTTASIYNALKEKIDLKDVYIQIKLTVINSEKSLDGITSRISEYANTQNRISMSDLKANHPSLVQLENISRTTWVPSLDKGKKSEEKWFFERARGQYLVEVNRQSSPAQKRAFQKQNPKSKVLTKTQTAKYYMSWEQVPHVVSKGSEANFEKFIEYIDTEKIDIDSNLFKGVVSKGILFNECDKIVKELDYPGYKANVVSYTVAMLSYIYEKKFDFDKVWKLQNVDNDIREKLKIIAQHTWKHITSPPVAGTNITQWCKKGECWETYKEKSIDIRKQIVKEKYTSSP